MRSPPHSPELPWKSASAWKSETTTRDGRAAAGERAESPEHARMPPSRSLNFPKSRRDSPPRWSGWTHCCADAGPSPHSASRRASSWRTPRWNPFWSPPRRAACASWTCPTAPLAPPPSASSSPAAAASPSSTSGIENPTPGPLQVEKGATTGSRSLDLR
eukprot:1183875-Prorocentrum_minimum.AAC.4